MNKNHSRARNSFKNSAVRRILGWMPSAVLLLITACLSVMMLLGGMARMWAWYLLMKTPIFPFLGLIFLIYAVLQAIRRRRISKPMLINGLVSLLFLAPILLWALALFGPILPWNLSLSYPASIDTTKPTATVRLPANVPLKTSWGGNTLKVNYHVTVPNQRWAYDFCVEPCHMDSLDLTDYGCYGVPVVAPAAGIVTTAHDGEPDTPIDREEPVENGYGNFIALKLDETGTYLEINHLKPGSLLVKVGEHVEEGQAIAQCGNSGNSTEPHIHINHQRQEPTIDSSAWFTEGLPLFFRDHDGPPMPEGGMHVEKGKIIATGITVQHIGK